MQRPEPGRSPTRAGADFDPSSDPRFVEYYSRASRSDETLGRFTRIMDRALALKRGEGHPTSALAVLDVGCGAGTQAALWAAAGHQVMAIDISVSLVALACARAREHGLNITYTVGSATAMPFASDSADVVLMPELLEHVVEWERCLEEAARVLRPGDPASWTLCDRRHDGLGDQG